MIKIAVATENKRAAILKRWLIDNIGPDTTSRYDSADDLYPGGFWARGEGWCFGWLNGSDKWDIYFDKEEDALLFQLRWS